MVDFFDIFEYLDMRLDGFVATGENLGKEQVNDRSNQVTSGKSEKSDKTTELDKVMYDGIFIETRYNQDNRK